MNTIIKREDGKPTEVTSRFPQASGGTLVTRTFGERIYVVVANNQVMREKECATADEARMILKPQSNESLYLKIQ